MEGKSYHYLVLFIGLFLCLLHSGGVSSSCDNINEIDFAEITYDPEGLAPHPDGTVANIECGVFYQIVPTGFERTTCTTGAWTGTLPRCRHVPRYCQRNEDLVQIYGRDCQTQCRNRLTGACPENKRCHCDGVCGWSCISIYEDDFCPEVADQAGLLVTYDPPERRFNGYADFSCAEGYIYHSGSRRLLCMSNRQWGGGNEFVCIPNKIICEDPGVPVNGYKTNEKQVYHLDDVVYFHCNEGYTMNGSIPNFCTESGEWAHPVPVCGGPCTVPPYPRDGRWQNNFQYPRGTSVPHNTRLQLRCNWRFDERQNSVRCNDGVWSDSDAVDRFCRGPPCRVRGSIGVALIITYDPPVSEEDRLNHFIPHDTRAHYACARGYRLQGVTEIRCDQGRYNNVIPRCELVPCLAEEVSHGKLIYTTPDGVNKHDHPLHGDTRRLNCGSGYISRSFNRSRCDNGAWVNEGSHEIRCHPTPPRCMLPERSRGERYFITGFTENIFDEGLPIGERVHISVRCDPGYTAQPAVQTACLERGVWSVSVPICVRMERLCTKPGYISRVVQYVNGLETNKLATYPHDELPEGTFLVSRCSRPGEYVLRGSANRTCSDSSWTGEEPSCVSAVTSIIFQNNQPLEVRSNGRIVIHPRGQLYISCRMPYYSNKVARFESDNGPGAAYWGRDLSAMYMTLAPPRTSHSGRFTCQSVDSSLSHTVYVQFVEIYCDSPRAPTNGEIQDYDYGWKHGQYYMGKGITFTCNDGYSLDGARRMTCVFGEWSHPVPRCQTEDYVPPLINLTVIAIDHYDPSEDAVAPDTEISAFVADPLSRFGTMKIASAFTGPDGIVVLSVPHNQSLIITANLDGALVNSITTKANLKQKNIVTIPMAGYEELNLFRWLTASSNAFRFGGEEGTAQYKVSIPSGSLRVRNRRLVQIEFYGVNLTIPEQLEHAPEPIAVLNAELVALDIAGMMELNVFETSTSFRSVSISQPVTITIPITSLSEEFSAGDFLDAWYFDEGHGVWVKDGTGIIEQYRDSEMLVWQYEATHFTWWAAGKPQDQTSCVKVKTCLDGACNHPVPGIRIQLTGEDYGFSSSRTTDRYAEAYFNFRHGRTVILEAVCAMERVTVASTALPAAFDNADTDIPSVSLDPLLPSDVCREVTLMLPTLASNMTCPDPGEVEFSVHSLNGRKYSDVVQYTCDMGRTQEGEGYRTCLECGLWSDRPVECILI